MASDGIRCHLIAYRFNQRRDDLSRFHGFCHVHVCLLRERGDDGQERRSFALPERFIERIRGRRLDGYELPDELLKRRPANTKDAPLWELRLRSRRETGLPPVGRDLADEIVLLDQSAGWGIFWYK